MNRLGKYLPAFMFIGRIIVYKLNFILVLQYMFILLVSLLYIVFFPSITLAYLPGMNAYLVLGQTNFVSGGANPSGSITSNGLSAPEGIATDGTHVFISDTGNNRVLIYNSFPTANNQTADLVIGQSNFTSGGSNQGGSVAANTLSSPSQIAITNGKLIIADSGNNRVLVFNTIPTTNNASASVVIGQPDMSSSTAGTTSVLFSNPQGVSFDENTNLLIISDTGNNRVLLYNGIPAAHGQAANMVAGQSDFVSSTAGTTSSIVSSPRYAIVFSGKLLVSDTGNHRVLIWNSIPTSNGSAASNVIGQIDFTSSSANQGGLASASTLSTPLGLAYDWTRLIIDDSQNNRILLLNGIPGSDNSSAYSVIGQSNLTGSGSGTAANSLSANGGIFLNGSKLLVADTNNNRVVFFTNSVYAPQIDFDDKLTGIANGKLRLFGRISIGSLYTVQSADYQVNRGLWSSVTPVDGKFDESAENYYFDFDPKSENNKYEGFNAKVRAKNSNLDLSDGAFYFQPFTINQPAKLSISRNPYPTFDFSVNKNRINMIDNISYFQVWTKRPGTSLWTDYLSYIPFNFEKIKNNPENLQKSTYGNIDVHTGIYQTKYIKIEYLEDGSRIVVHADDQVHHAYRRMFGTYDFKIAAVDKIGHKQDTGERRFLVDSFGKLYQQNYFPLSIQSIEGLGRVDFTTSSLPKKRAVFRTPVLNPAIEGIANQNSHVVLTLYDEKCIKKDDKYCSHSFEATADSDSKFHMRLVNLPSNISAYLGSLYVYNGDRYNELPAFYLIPNAVSKPIEPKKNSKILKMKQKSNSTPIVKEKTKVTTKLRDTKTSQNSLEKHCFLFLCTTSAE